MRHLTLIAFYYENLPIFSENALFRERIFPWTHTGLAVILAVNAVVAGGVKGGSIVVVAGSGNVVVAGGGVLVVAGFAVVVLACGVIGAGGGGGESGGRIVVVDGGVAIIVGVAVSVLAVGTKNAFCIMKIFENVISLRNLQLDDLTSQWDH